MSTVAEQNYTKYQREYKRRYRDEKLKAGLCVDCGQPAITGKTRCERCGKMALDRASRAVQRRRDAGTCIRCGQPPVQGKNKCQPCANQDAISTLQTQDRGKRLVLDHYGNHCNECGHTDLDVLTIEHIGGRQKFGHGRKMTGITLYSWLIRNNFPQGFELLCMNCNFKRMIQDKHAQSRIRVLMLAGIPTINQEEN